MLEIQFGRTENIAELARGDHGTGKTKWGFSKLKQQ